MSSVDSPPGANAVDDAGQDSVTQTADATGIDAPAGQEAGNTGAEQSASKEGHEDHIDPPLGGDPQGEENLLGTGAHGRQLLSAFGELSLESLAHDQVLQEAADQRGNGNGAADFNAQLGQGQRCSSELFAHGEVHDDCGEEDGGNTTGDGFLKCPFSCFFCHYFSPLIVIFLFGMAL